MPFLSDLSADSLLGSSAEPAVMEPQARAVVGDCASLCSNFSPSNWALNSVTCTTHEANVAVDTPNGQANSNCGDSFTPEIDICQVQMNVQTSGESSTYVEVWLPSSTDDYNGRTMSTDNGGLNGCVHYVDMEYISSLGFATIGDNAGHNGSSFDGTWMLNANEKIVDWADRSRHASVEIGKEVVNAFYGEDAAYSYYIGCSAGGQQGLHSAQYHPDDFDGIISGAPSADFQNLQSWSARFIQLTGTEGDETFLTKDQWSLVQTQIEEECDEALDGVADGIIEDPTICSFNSSALDCSVNNATNCLSSKQIETVNSVFTPLTVGDSLRYPSLLPGSQVDAFTLGQLSGSVQGIARDFFQAVHNDSSFDVTAVDSDDYDLALSLDAQMGYPSSFNADLSSFRDAGGKLLLYHGLSDPLTSGANSQRYYLNVASQLSASASDLDAFFRYFRISGMAHCGVGGIQGAGAWMFGQSKAAKGAETNIVDRLVDWVENDNAPDTLEGTKFVGDKQADGISFTRRHCRFPYRTTYSGSGDGSDPDSWTCEFIDNWQDCDGSDGNLRLC
jgi:feruloyl esterase